MRTIKRVREERKGETQRKIRRGKMEQEGYHPPTKSKTIAWWSGQAGILLILLADVSASPLVLLSDTVSQCDTY